MNFKEVLFHQCTPVSEPNLFYAPLPTLIFEFICFKPSGSNTVYELLREIDPEGLAQRLRKTCKQRIFRTLGPNHVWACDGHDKLKKYGIIDAWSRKILGMFVHVTNNDPKHIGVYFLQTAAKAGGIPLKVTTDFSSETIDMVAYQMFLSYHHAGISIEEASKRMHFTKSTRNQKIEALWSQMMKHHNQAVIDAIEDQIEHGGYDADNEIEKKRRDHRISLPTVCTPDFSYSTPESFDTTNQLLPVPASHIQEILQEEYLDQELMFTQTPPWFHNEATGNMAALGLRFGDISIGSVWSAYEHMLPYIKRSFPDDQPLPSYGWPPEPTTPTSSDSDSDSEIAGHQSS
ncbi:hypothetical protein PTTG_00765 [Puccinia triticina 1-1 BBBD Race 1]|uniref:Integrase core domain-containing protein n=1 Tax=Puccinia triticina (isolate 1-1 / race 1 (BBBD)) TaxID=630390 RepID=A0A180GR08_PUCT1|nr:hypothetical protein PTTG_00765 [Puccinia triticina 1-1 BBBD Race 1]